MARPLGRGGLPAPAKRVHHVFRRSCALAVAVAVVVIVPAVADADPSRGIDYSTFNDPSALRFVGTASALPSGSALEIATSDPGSVGAVWAMNEIRTDRPFSIEFESAQGGGDGETFTIQDAGLDAVGSNGAGMGVGLNANATPASPVIRPSVAIEYDIWQNAEFGDSALDHVGLDVNGDMHSAVAADFDLRNPSTYKSWIDYDPAAGLMSVYVAYVGYMTPVKPSSPLFTWHGDLSAVVGPIAFLGFTASNGISSGDHQIFDWYGTGEFVGSPPAPPTAVPMKHVSSMASLGDSYSSGEGDSSFICGTDLRRGTYWQNTNVPAAWATFGHGSCDTRSGQPLGSGVMFRGTPKNNYDNTCHVSGRAYGNIIARDFNLAPTDMLFDACSGAIIANIGYVDPEAQHPLSPAGVPGGHTQEEDLGHFRDRLGRSPDLITIGVGGNDASFVDLATACLFPGSDCNSEYWWTRFVSEVAIAYPKWRLSFEELRISYGARASIVAFGYPDVVDYHQQGFSPSIRGSVSHCLRVPTLSAGEARFIHDDVLVYLNATLGAAATSAGISFVDPLTVPSLQGHDVCTALPPVGANPWFNGIVGHGSLQTAHPKSVWHEKLAEYFMSAYTSNGNLFLANPTPRTIEIGDILVPSPTTLPPAGRGGPPLILAASADVRSSCGHGCYTPSTCSQFAPCSISVSARGLTPGTTMRAVVASRPRYIGSVVVSPVGSVHATLRVPRGLRPGQHAVTLTGTAPGGHKEQAVGAFSVAATAYNVRLTSILRADGHAAGKLTCPPWASSTCVVTVATLRRKTATRVSSTQTIRVRRGHTVAFRVAVRRRAAIFLRVDTRTSAGTVEQLRRVG